jgi:HAD superfamily 5'-nucleotidase-like hydrolase
MGEPAVQSPLLLDALAHLLETPSPQPIPPQRRIYVNRDLRMDNIEMIGFDMDYTLATYAKPHIEELAFRLTLRRLVEGWGYPEEILGLRYDPAICMRGVVIDKKLGNILKMDRYRHVGRGYHGRRPLAKEDRRALYRGVQMRLKTPRYHLIDTLFALPEVALFVEVVELADRGMAPYPAPESIFNDIRAAIDLVHRDDSLKSRIRADPGRYLAQDPDLPLALHKFRSSGKRLFLVTNSLWDYTDTALGFLLSGRLAEYPVWRNFFDVVVVGANKPHFFTGTDPFEVLDARGQVVGRAAGRFERLRVYQGGNLADFERLAQCGGDRILYVGDHIYGDILRSKKHSAWRTAMIVEELEEEIAHIHRRREEFQKIQDLQLRCQDLDVELNYLQSVHKTLQKAEEREGLAPDDTRALEAARRQVRAQIDQARRELHESLETLERLETECDAAANPYWGMIFKEGLETTRFGDQVRDYACVYTSRVSNFLFYSPTQYFRSSRDVMPHERL